MSRTALGRLDAGLLGIGVLLLATFSPTFAGDGAGRLGDLTAVIQRGVIPHEDHWSLIGPLFSAPLWPLGLLTGTAPIQWVARFNLILLCAGLAGFWVALRDRMDRETLRSALLLLLTCSLFAHEVTAYGAETFTALLLGLGIVLVVAGSRELGWVAAVIGAANTPAAIGGLGIAAAVHTTRLRRLRYLLIPVAALAVVELELVVRNGTLVTNHLSDHGVRTLMPYSGRPGFSYPLFLGLISILFSFGKGLVWFAPGLLLPIRGALRTLGQSLTRTYGLWLAFLLGLVLAYSKWWAWYGGLSWGPRYFVFASIPASFAIAIALRHGASPWLRLGALGALALSAWVGFDGVAFGQATQAYGQHQCNIALEHLCWYVPEFSVLWHPFVALPALDLRSSLYAAFCTLVVIRLAAPTIPGLWRWARDGLSSALRASRVAGWRF